MPAWTSAFINRSSAVVVTKNLNGNAAMFWAGNKTWKPSFVQMTQAAYDALTPKDASTLYVVVG